ncbi:MAG: (Fe-S)-binding protein [Chloroflexota bacterium]|nr:(Fe-S)-binding protein [Chloroflexota bacterium]
MATAPQKPQSEDGISLFSGPDAPQESELYKCVHCGFCLQACPTYVETGLEAESPRGRLALMKAVNEGRIGITDTVMRHWDLCIQCRACEVACPSGVPYGNLIEATMQQVADRRKPGFVNGKIASFALNKLLPNQRMLSMVIGSMRLYQRLGIQSVMRRSGLLKLLPGNMGDLEESMPSLPSEVFKARGQVYHAQGEFRARVALLSGCVMPLVHGPEMNAVVRVLTRNGCDVVVTKGQGCCGAINSHVGDLEVTRELARLNIDAFLAEDVDHIVVASAGCGSRMKEYGHLLRNDPAYADKAEALSAKVKDIHELLAVLPIVPPKGHLPYRVTYQDSCHLSNAQRVTAPPRQLLNAIPGIEFVELSNADKCCGAGGTYTITERDFSMRILDTKMRAVRETRADVIATANPGCLMQMQFGAQRDGMEVQVKYITDLLDESYSKESSVVRRRR